MIIPYWRWIARDWRGEGERAQRTRGRGKGHKGQRTEERDIRDIRDIRDGRDDISRALAHQVIPNYRSGGFGAEHSIVVASVSCVPPVPCAASPSSR